MSGTTEGATPGGTGAGRERVLEEHPSYGMISVRRTHGGGEKLFGSPVRHHSKIVLTVRRGVVERELNRNWYFGREQVVEVELSAAQFAELITSMNHGDGVPCTLRYVGGRRMPDCPEGRDPREQVEDEFAQAMRRASAAFDESLAGLDGLLAKKTLTREDRARLRAILSEARRLFDDRLSFAQRSFGEATERTVRAAQAELEAFFATLVQRAGIERLAGQGGGAGPDVLPPELPALAGAPPREVRAAPEGRGNDRVDPEPETADA